MTVNSDPFPFPFPLPVEVADQRRVELLRLNEEPIECGSEAPLVWEGDFA